MSDLMDEFMRLFCSGVEHDDKTSGGRVSDGAGVDRPLVRGGNIDSAGNPIGGAPMKPERHGITRQPDNPNVLEVDFAHFRFVRDVRASVYGVRGSPLSTDVRTRR